MASTMYELSSPQSAKRPKATAKRVSWGDDTSTPNRTNTYGGWGLVATKVIPNLDELRALHEVQLSPHLTPVINLPPGTSSPTGAMAQIAQEKRRWEKQRKSSQLELLKQRSQTQAWRIPKLVELPEDVQSIQREISQSVEKQFTTVSETIEIPLAPKKEPGKTQEYDPADAYDPAMAMEDVENEYKKKSRWETTESTERKPKAQSRWHQPEGKKSRWSSPRAENSSLSSSLAPQQATSQPYSTQTYPPAGPQSAPTQYPGQNLWSPEMNQSGTRWNGMVTESQQNNLNRPSRFDQTSNYSQSQGDRNVMPGPGFPIPPEQQRLSPVHQMPQSMPPYQQQGFVQHPHMYPRAPHPPTQYNGFPPAFQQQPPQPMMHQSQQWPGSYPPRTHPY